MERAKWEQVKDIFDDALKRAPDERGHFLSASCNGDDELRREVESLLSSFDSANSFLQKPAVGEVADVVIGTNNHLPEGQRISHYKIIRQIGAGGMGEVYLAEDARLHRKVAFKVLPQTFASDIERLRRFEQEAFAASALNHPNILTVYEFGFENDTHFLATELIEGETLREIISGSELSLSEALHIAEQTAFALSAAHVAGIVHRDLKPENIMIRLDGIVKVLDFGLAKLIEKKEFSPDAEAETRALVKTNSGVVMGTAVYMSPEQARGKDTDARTDVWSLGVLIYEMACGKLPFAGETTNDVIASILKSEPPILSHYVSDVPNDLEKIVGKCLRKNRDERYQNIKDLQIDLKDLRKELEFEAKLTRSVAPNKNRANSPDKNREAQTQILESEPTGATEAAISTKDSIAHPPSSAEYVGNEIKQHKRGIFTALSILILAAVGFGYWFYANRSASTDAKQINSIAVLPFVNESGSSDVEYLSDGMTETLINSLSQLPKLSVKARSSVFRYKGKQTDARQVGADLNVQAVLNGRVIQRNDDLTLYLSLVDAATENQIWGKQYNQKLSNLVALQNEIARDVSNNLQTRLSGADEQTLAKTYTENSEAYQLYLKGRFFWNRRTEEGLRKGLDYFEQAISKDPEYDLAYVGLADSYNVLGFYSFLPPKESFPKAKAAAGKALELNEKLSEAHNSLAYATLYYDWDFAAAEMEFKRAIELNPNYPTAHQWYGNLLTATGRWDEAIQEFKHAQELDPLSLVIIAVPGWTYYYARQYDRAVEHCQKAIDMDRNFALAHNWLGQVYERKAMYERAISEFKEGLRLSGGEPDVAALLAHVYAVSGNKRQAQAILDNLISLSERRYVSPYHIATIYVGLGEKDQALKWLNVAYSDRQNVLVFLKHDARLDNLRADPRFQDLLQRIGFMP